MVRFQLEDRLLRAGAPACKEKGVDAPSPSAIVKGERGERPEAHRFFAASSTRAGAPTAAPECTSDVPPNGQAQRTTRLAALIPLT